MRQIYSIQMIQMGHKFVKVICVASKASSSLQTLRYRIVNIVTSSLILTRCFTSKCLINMARSVGISLRFLTVRRKLMNICGLTEKSMSFLNMLSKVAQSCMNILQKCKSLSPPFSLKISSMAYHKKETNFQLNWRSLKRLSELLMNSGLLMRTNTSTS